MAFDEQRLANRVNLANQSIQEKYHAGMLSFEQEAAVEELAKRGRIDLSPPQRNPLSASTLDISHGNPFYSVSELDKLRAQHQKEQEWEQQYGAKIEGLEQPWIDPVEALAGGLASIPRGLAAAGAEMVIDPLVGFGLERATEGNALSAMAGGKRSLGKATLSGLDMSEAGRLQRARDLGFETEAFSGSTHDIKAFRGDLANPEGDWGRGTYASTSIEDVNVNYAGEGADLTNRIEMESERVVDELQDAIDEVGIDDALDTFGLSKADYNADTTVMARTLAKKKLVGSAEGGIVYPLKMNTKNYAVVGGDRPTMLADDIEGFDALARSEVDRVDYDDIDDFEEAISDRIWELKAEDPDSVGLKVSDALHESDIYQDTNIIQEIMGELDEEIMDGTLRIDSLDEAIRRHVVDAYDDNGDMLSSGEISSQVLKNLGFDGVVDKNVYRKFGAGRQYGTGMEGITPDTAHIITFPGKESTLRSRFARFDPSKIGSSDILAGALPVGLGLGGLGSKVSEDNN